MKNRPIHENLDTSYVNLSALIKYLRRRQFVGNVKVQLNGYRAEIELQEDNQMKVSEHDQISGRVSSGEEALQRLLIRAREPGGTINVYQLIEEKPLAKTAQRTPVQTPLEDELIVEAQIAEPFVQAFPTNGKAQNGNSVATHLKREMKTASQKKENLANAPKPKKREKSLPDFPFALRNKVEDKARQNEVSNDEWQLILKLTVELLGLVDQTLARADLDFSAAFAKVRTEIADDYPFLNPSGHKFDYQHGKIKLTEKINAKIFIASMIESLRRILNKLESNPKFAELHRQTVQTIIALMHKRRPQYDKFAITPQLKRILGLSE